MPRVFNSPEIDQAQRCRAIALRWGRTEEADRLAVEVKRLRAAHFRALAEDLDREADGMASAERG